MKNRVRIEKLIIFVLACAIFPITHVEAHPGSGIVVDRRGNVYFIDTGAGVWKIDSRGTLSRHPGPGYHWMAIDLDGNLENVSLPSFGRGDAVVERAGHDPTILLSSDFPILVGRDGNLYYPWKAESACRCFVSHRPARHRCSQRHPPARTANCSAG